MDKYALGYLTLSLLSGFVELGAVIFVIREELPLFYVPLMGLAYQLGALFREPVELAPWQYYLMLVLSVLSAIFASHSPVLLFLTVFLLSVGIQGIRGMLSKMQESSTFVKRVFRVVGFACSGLFSWYGLLLVPIIAVAITAVLARDLKGSKKLSIPRTLSIGPLGWIMMVHQSHYFSYAYIIPLLMVNYHAVDSRVAGLLFCIGWLSYIFSRKVFGETRLIRNFALGHVLASTTLAGIFLFFTDSIAVLLFLWFLTGFGGGTVYCLRQLRAESRTDKSDMDVWENVGHILGILICLTVLSTSQSVRLVFAVASMIAAATCILFLLIGRERGVLTNESR